MEFRDYVSVLRKYWVSITLLTVLGAAAAMAYVMYAPKVYTSTSTVYLAVSGGSSAADLSQGASYSATQARSFAQIATMPSVLNPVIKKLELDTTATDLSRHVTATIPTNTSLITISASNGDPVRSAQIAQQVALSLCDRIQTLSPAGPDARADVVATIEANAAVPEAPTSPQPVRSLALGVVAGLVVGVGLAIIRKALDVKVHTAKDLTDQTEYPVIATIPRDPALPKDPVIMVANPNSPTAERYRQLRTNLRFFDIDPDTPWNFAVTSSIEGEGKTVTAINIAYALAENGEKVLLIDADLRRPKVASYLGLEGAAGLTTILLNRALFYDVVQTLGPGSPDVLPSGGIPPNPAELIGSRRMKQLLEQVSNEYKAVVIDAAPLLPVADTLSLLPIVGGTVMVASAEKVTIPQIKAALDSANRAGAQIMGMVLNRVRRRSGVHEYYNYSYEPDRRSRAAAAKRARG